MGNGLHGKPVFAAKTDDFEYPGITEPIFDEELTPPVIKEQVEAAGDLPLLTERLSSGVPAAGKGPSRGYEIRRRMIAQLHARGFTNNQIGKHLGYSPAGVSIALKDPWVKSEVEKERLNLIDEDAPAVLKAASLHAAKRIERVIMDPESKNGDQMSQFVIEKNYGKAKQEVTHESHTLTAYLELLKTMHSRGEVIDVTQSAQSAIGAPSTEPAQDQWDGWLDLNV